jgi:hypothetical protein
MRKSDFKMREARANEPSQIRFVNTFLLKGNEEKNLTSHLQRGQMQPKGFTKY